jgi:hypothetical protein
MENRTSVAVIAHGIVQNYNATFTLILTNSTKKTCNCNTDFQKQMSKNGGRMRSYTQKAPKKFHWTEARLSPGNRRVNCRVCALKKKTCSADNM